MTDATGNVINQTQYKAWGEERYSSGVKQTGYGYTGQYSYASDFGLHFYNARWYDSSLGRFAQADTIIPGAGNPQAWDRYAYANNSPLRYTDPTGHRNCEEDGYNCPGDQKAKFPKRNWYTWWAQAWAKKSGGYMSTYAIAGIGVQNPYWPPRSLLAGAPRINLGIIGGEYTGVGPSKVTDAEMNTPYGEKIYDTSGDFRGIGLGMPGQDQTKGKVAVQAMVTRIQLRTEVCDIKCTSTDIFLIAALGQNGPGFNPSDVELLMNGKDYKPRPNGTYSLNWNQFLSNSNERQFNREMIAQFAGNVLYLQQQGWDVPNNIDWDFVYALTVSSEQP